MKQRPQGLPASQPLWQEAAANYGSDGRTIGLDSTPAPRVLEQLLR